LLSGLDPKLANASDPTILERPTNSSIAVNSLWFASLLTSLGSSLHAIVCKGWFAEYNSGVNSAIGLLRACKRHTRSVALQQLDVHAEVALLSAYLHSSVLLFLVGAAVYLSRMDERMVTVFAITGGIFGLNYFGAVMAPFMTTPPFLPYSTSRFYRLLVIIRKTTRGTFVNGLRSLIDAVPLPLVSFSTGPLLHWCMQAWIILRREYYRMNVWFADALNGSPDEIDTSQKVQEEAIMWLSQVPLDPFESKALVSSLALIFSSRPHKIQKPVITFLNSVLEASLRETSQSQTDTIIDCILVLGHMKFQSAVDRNRDRDHNIGGVPITASVAWAVQQLTTNTFREKPGSPHSEEIHAQLLTAAAWLSPVESAEDVHLDGGGVVEIQGRYQFIQEIRDTLLRHAGGEKVLDNELLINLVRGMHACIPRGNYGSESSIVSFLPLFCNNYESPWSKDEGVLNALITYALDLLGPGREKPMVKREIEFEKLASELIDTLMTTTVTYTEVVTFGFWLIYRVPYAFKSRKTLLTDITHIWALTDAVVPEDHREQINFHAVDAFAAVAQFHAVANGQLPEFTSHTALKLLKVGLACDYSRATATYAVAMILNLGTSDQTATFTSGIAAESFGEVLFDVKSDLEKNAMEEDVVDLHVYSTLILLKFRTIELEVGRVKTLIGKMDKAIVDSITSDSGVARNPGTEVNPELDRVRWKAIYLSALLFRFVPKDERQDLMGGFGAKVRALLGSGGLSLADDYERCIELLVMDALELSTPVGEWGPAYIVFET